MTMQSMGRSKTTDLAGGANNSVTPTMPSSGITLSDRLAIIEALKGKARTPLQAIALGGLGLYRANEERQRINAMKQQQRADLIDLKDRMGTMTPSQTAIELQMINDKYGSLDPATTKAILATQTQHTDVNSFGQAVYDHSISSGKSPAEAEQARQEAIMQAQGAALGVYKPPMNRPQAVPANIQAANRIGEITKSQLGMTGKSPTATGAPEYQALEAQKQFLQKPTARTTAGNKQFLQSEDASLSVLIDPTTGMMTDLEGNPIDPAELEGTVLYKPSTSPRAAPTRFTIVKGQQGEVQLVQTGGEGVSAGVVPGVTAAMQGQGGTAYDRARLRAIEEINTDPDLTPEQKQDAVEKIDKTFLGLAPRAINRLSAEDIGKRTTAAGKAKQELPQTKLANALSLNSAMRNDPILKQYFDVQQKLNGLTSVEQKALSTGKVTFSDQALITMFNKITDPISVVRESEYARTPEGLALLNRWQGGLEKLAVGGAGLTDADRKELLNTAKTFFEGYTKSATPRVKYYQNLGKAAELDPELYDPFLQTTIPTEGGMAGTTDAENVPTIKTQKDFDALPSGSQFREEDGGEVFVKP